MVVNLHPPTGMARPPYEFGRENRVLRPIIAAQEPQRTMAIMIASGILERFPKMKVVCAEYGIGWVPFWLEKIEGMKGTGSSRRGGFSTPLSLTPIEYFERQMYVTYIEEPRGVKHRDEIGINQVMWSSDYPHAASTWPDSGKLIARDFEGSPEDERKVTHDNVAELYGFKV